MEVSAQEPWSRWSFPTKVILSMIHVSVEMIDFWNFPKSNSNTVLVIICYLGGWFSCFLAGTEKAVKISFPVPCWRCQPLCVWQASELCPSCCLKPSSPPAPEGFNHILSWRSLRFHNLFLCIQKDVFLMQFWTRNHPLQCHVLGLLCFFATRILC